MGKLMTLVFTTIFSGIGWAWGEPYGVSTAVVLCVVFTGIGWVAAKRFMKWLDE